MRHVEKALKKYHEKSYPEAPHLFIEIENVEDVKGVAPIVKFTIQSDPISEVGVNMVSTQKKPIPAYWGFTPYMVSASWLYVKQLNYFFLAFFIARLKICFAAYSYVALGR